MIMKYQKQIVKILTEHKDGLTSVQLYQAMLENSRSYKLFGNSLLGVFFGPAISTLHETLEDMKLDGQLELIWNKEKLTYRLKNEPPHN